MPITILVKILNKDNLNNNKKNKNFLLLFTNNVKANFGKQKSNLIQTLVMANKALFFVKIVVLTIYIKQI